MMDRETGQTNIHENNRPLKLKFLVPSEIAVIDEALSAVGDSGEVRLIVEMGRLQFVVTKKSFVMPGRKND
jgi:hypothetical protein